MSVIGELVEAVKRVDALLASPDLEPRPERDDWPSVKKKIEELRGALGEIASLFDAAIEETEGTEIGPMIKRRVATLYGEVAAVLVASGDGLRAAELLAKAERAMPQDEEKALLSAGQREPPVFARLMLAQYLLQDGRFDDADREAKRVKRETKQAPIAERAKKLLSGPRPLKGPPPSLFTLNGFGTGLYGSRDRDEEGRYVATYCVCALFVPVFPISAYRVQSLAGNSYRFFARERLSPFARIYQAVVGLAAAAAIAGVAIDGYLSSPGRRSGIALQEAQATEQAGQDQAALEGYRRVVDGFSPVEAAAAVTSAAEGIARLSAKAVPSPCTASSVEAARRAVNGFASLPESVREATSASALAKRMDECATEIGDSNAASARAALRVLDLAADAVAGGPDQGFIDGRRTVARRAFAARVAEGRPLLALGELAKMRDVESVAAAKALVTGLGADPSLWVDAEADIERWAANARELNEPAGADALATLAAARKKHEENAAVVEAGDEKAIEKAASEQPGNQELACALAGSKRARGDTKGALAIMEKLGPPGRLTARAQQLLASLHGDQDNLARADEILSALVDERLPSFQDAQQAFRVKANEVEERISNELQVGRIPVDLELRLQGKVSDADKRDEVQSWMSERITSDPSFAALRTDYVRRGQVVPASLALGMIKLRRASDAGGEERKRLLAQAEEAFLSIRSEASGDPTFHLGLGQVYHRLGKTEEGDKELESVIERKVPELTYAVAQTYRELGLLSRARKVARDLLASSPEQQIRYNTAGLLAHMAEGLDDEEQWLRKADPQSPYVLAALDRVAGDRLLREGKRAEADQKFKRCVDFFARDAKTNAVSANNAATETMKRYEATGDPAHLATAATYLESATRLNPDNALIFANLADTLALLAYVRVLEKWVDTRALAFGRSDARGLVDAMSDGGLSAELLDALRKDPTLQRALDAEQKYQILAPQAVGAYVIHLSWAMWNHDVEALRELQKRIDLLPTRGDNNADLREKWLAGELDASRLREHEADVALARQRVARTKGSSGPTQAVAARALSRALGGLAFFQHEPALLDEMVDTARKAHGGWPEGLPSDDLADALVMSSLFRALGASPAFEKAWEKDRRRFSVTSAAYRVISGPDSGELSGALKKDPGFNEAVALHKQGVVRNARTSDFITARLAGDAELEQAAAKLFDRADLGLWYAIASRLDPTDPEEAMFVAILRSRGKSLE